jgi:DNA-binding IclR family transcriptional regulator
LTKITKPRKVLSAEQRASAAEGSLVRMLELLDLFTPAAPIWSADDLIRYLGLSRSTGYRYIRALHSAGLIASVANGYYILGERIIELDRQIRHYDPIYLAGGQVMKSLVKLTGCSALLCALFKDSVMCVREELVENSPASLFSRGQRRPLFSGAASKIILPYLPPHQLRNIFKKHKKSIATAGLGSDWSTFRSKLSTMRRQGYAVTIGEFNPMVVGLSAPIFNKSRNILGSIGIAALESDFPMDRLEQSAQAVISVANEITEVLSSTDILLNRPPRGVG